MRYWLALLLLSSLVGFAPPQDPAGKARKANPGDPAPAPAPEQETISVETNLVVVNVTVTDARERYVAGLKAEEFRVFEDQAPQRITSFAFEEMPFAAVILLDTSGSMEAKMSLARAACSRFAGGIREGDSVAIYSFGGTKVRMLQDFTELRDVADAVWDLRADGDTPLYDGIVKAAEELGRRPERRRAILLVSDGADTRSRATQDDALRKVAVANVAVYAVDLSDAALYRTARRDSGADVLKDLAAKSGGRFYRTPGGSQLRDAFVATVEELRSQYTLTYEPSNERRDGRWRTVDVRVNRPALNVRARQGYHAPKARQ